MSSSIPVIASGHIGPREIIKNGYNGYLINSDPFKDNLSFIKELYNKILLLSENEKLRKQMGLRGRQTAVMNYDIRVNMENGKKFLNMLSL